LPIDEFYGRLRQAYEKESRERGDDADPLNAMMKMMSKKTETGKRWA